MKNKKNLKYGMAAIISGCQIISLSSGIFATATKEEGIVDISKQELEKLLGSIYNSQYIFKEGELVEAIEKIQCIFREEDSEDKTEFPGRLTKTEEKIEYLLGCKKGYNQQQINELKAKLDGVTLKEDVERLNNEINQLNTQCKELDKGIVAIHRNNYYRRGGGWCLHEYLCDIHANLYEYEQYLKFVDKIIETGILPQMPTPKGENPVYCIPRYLKIEDRQPTIGDWKEEREHVLKQIEALKKIEKDVNLTDFDKWF